MAEMQQNGTPLQQSDFGAGALGFPLQQQQGNGGVNMDNMANLDPASYMSPMDLYESIWWESPDPFNAGLDTMNFDFVAQPPPGQPQQQYYF